MNEIKKLHLGTIEEYLEKIYPLGKKIITVSNGEVFCYLAHHKRTKFNLEEYNKVLERLNEEH